VLFFDRAVDTSLKFPENVKTVVLFPPTRHPFLWIFWLEFSLSLALKKHRIDVFWSPDGFCSLLSSIPQIITIHDINFEHYPKDVPRIARIYFQYFFPKFAKKAKHILTVSNYSKADISKTYSIAEQKISVVYNAPNSLYKPISDQDKLAVKKEFCFDSDYFLFVGSIHPRKNIQRLIEGFALAKNDLNDLKLVIVGSAMWKDKFLTIPKEIEKDVLFLGHLSLENLTKVTASAFALTYVPYFEGFGIPLVEAMKCGVPILAADATCLPEVAGNSAVYCNPFDINSIANGMIELYGNKNLREELSQNGLKRSQEFSWNQSAEKVWSFLEKELN
jgi:glycosyltransferase involved in cell wall biosynthesis